MSVPRRGKRERNRAKMRERILTAVREMVLQLGTTDFTMAELAEAASVSLVTPYNYFGSKAAASPRARGVGEAPRSRLGVDGYRGLGPKRALMSATVKKFLTASGGSS